VNVKARAVVGWQIETRLCVRWVALLLSWVVLTTLGLNGEVHLMSNGRCSWTLHCH